MTASYFTLAAILFLSVFADVQSAPDAALQDIYKEVQWTLAHLHSHTGMPGEQLKQEAAKIAHLVEVYLINAGVNPTDEEVKDIITKVGSSFNNLASLTALFDDMISLETAKLDSAFIMLDKLSEMAISSDDPQKVYVILAAIHKTCLAIVDTVTETTDIFHYLNNDNSNNIPPSADPVAMVPVQRRRRETTVSGHVEASSSGGVSGGVSVSHTWRRRR